MPDYNDTSFDDSPFYDEQLTEEMAAAFRATYTAQPAYHTVTMSNVTTGAPVPADPTVFSLETLPEQWVAGPENVSTYGERTATVQLHVTDSTTQNEVVEANTAFVNWLATQPYNAFSAVVAHYHNPNTILGVHQPIPDTYMLTTIIHGSGALVSGLTMPEVTVCAGCLAERPPGTLECPSCLRSYGCHGCGVYGLPLVHDGSDSPSCLMCLRPCGRGCGRLTENWYTACNRCATFRGYCNGCDGQLTSADPGSERDSDGYWYCTHCRLQECVNCGRETRWVEYSSDWDGNICETCIDEGIRRPRSAPAEDEQEQSDPDSTLTGQELRIPTLPERKVRLCGLEIEGGGSYLNLATKLYEKGFTADPYISGYHASTREGHTGNSWSLEEDGSVDWELVSPIINLDSPSHMRKLAEVLKIVQDDIKDGSTYLDLRCGLHIHVSAQHFTPGHAFNLATIFGYVEDVMFRLGAAKWARHRAIDNGAEYCRPVDKTAKNKRQFGVHQERTMDRYGALSFKNFFSAMLNNCTCGATRYDSWDSCECELRKCTFEFRLFNSSVNMKKIHAYLALCQALVAKAASMDEIVDRDIEFPEDTYINREYASLSPASQEERRERWESRLRWLLTELPLTESEKLDVIYCVRNSELAVLGEEVIDSLVELPNPIDIEEVLA